MGRVADGEAFEDGEQQDLPLHRRHVGQRFLETAADAFTTARGRFHIAERLTKPMKQSEHTKLGILGLDDQLRLLHRHFGAQTHPFVALAL